jgi:enoyl-CoA hydratase/carnithine racemase
MGPFTDIGVETVGHVAVIEMRRPPHNFFDLSLLEQITTALDEIDASDTWRCSVLAAEGKSFCAGTNFNDPKRQNETPNPADGGVAGQLYRAAVRLFRTKKPMVGAIHGAAIGGGLGLALVPDFRVTCPEARFSANFTRLGFHPGFGLTVTLPELIGRNRAELLMYTGRRIGGEEAAAWGLANLCVPQDRVRAEAIKLATEISECAPLAIIETRASMRRDIADRFAAGAAHELSVQLKLRATEDFKEGIKAATERRTPNFKGK